MGEAKRKPKGLEWLETTNLSEVNPSYLAYRLWQTALDLEVAEAKIKELTKIMEESEAPARPFQRPNTKS